MPFYQLGGNKTPLRPVWLKIESNDGDGAYTVSEQLWDQTEESGKGGFVNRGSPPGYRSTTAYEVGLSTAGAVGQVVRGWQCRDITGAMKLLFQLSDPAWKWCRACTNWSISAGGGTWDDWRIKTHPLAGDVIGGDEDTDTTNTVYFRETPFGHPNAVDDEYIPYIVDAGGYKWAVGCMDARIGSIREWAQASAGAPANIPQGWQLCDGSNDPQGNPVPDLSGKFIVGYDAGDGDYDMGDTGGNKKQNLAHTQHRHYMQGCWTAVDTTTNPTGSWYILAVGPPGSEYTDYATQATHSDVDMRAPFYALAYIIRVDNSVAWT